MEIAGKKCRVCNLNIVLSREGKFCPLCQLAAHLACEPRTTCSVCGQAFQDFHRPKADVLSEALIPTPLRQPRSGGAVFAVSTVLILAFVFILALLITHGHAFSFR